MSKAWWVGLLGGAIGWQIIVLAIITSNAASTVWGGAKAAAPYVVFFAVGWNVQRRTAAACAQIAMLVADVVMLYTLINFPSKNAVLGLLVMPLINLLIVGPLAYVTAAVLNKAVGRNKLR